MRVFRIAFALWYDPLWWSNRHKGWKQRRYWLAAPPQTVLDGRCLALQLGPVTLRWHVQGIMNPWLGAGTPKARPERAKGSNP